MSVDPPITIVRGPSASASLREGKQNALVLEVDRRRPAAWSGVRALLGRLHELAPCELGQALERHRDALALVLPRLGPARVARALAPGYLSHNSALRWPLRQAWLDALGALLVGRELLIPDAAALDRESALFLVGLCARGISFRATIGLDPADVPEDPLRRRGVLNTRAVLDRLVFTGHARVQESLESGARAEAVLVGPSHPLDECIEARAHAALDQLVNPEEAIELARAALEFAFACFGFDSCYELGRRMLACSVPLDAMTMRRVHALLGLSAYNRQVNSRSGQPEDDELLARTLDQHFAAALADEPDPLLRAHGLYRLAINSGRRRGAIAAALELAEQAVALAERTRAPMHEAWTRNGRAYLNGRSGRLDLAIADCEAAFTLLEQADSTELEIERPMSRVVVAYNLAALHMWAGNHEAMRHWSRVQERASLALSSPVHPSVRLIEALRSTLELSEAAELATRGAEVAEQILDPTVADLYAALLADLRYRQGRASEALANYRRARAQAGREGDAQRERGTAIACAMAAMRSGSLDEAEAELAELLRTCSTDAVAEHTELLAMLGIVAARRGDAVAAEQRINEAIQAAVELGERDLLLRVACSAGEASSQLGRREDAAAAFAQALELVETGDPPAAADQLAAYVGALASGSDDVTLVERSLALLEEALDDAENWWLLEPLARACARLCPDYERAQLDRALRERA
jgi:tetratricopeptide (TPR) repeat protein